MPNALRLNPGDKITITIGRSIADKGATIVKAVATTATGRDLDYAQWLLGRDSVDGIELKIYANGVVLGLTDL
jgi:hypothetical protein